MKLPLKTRLKVSARGLFIVAKKPTYILLTLLISLLTLGVILWSLNIDLLGYILFDSPLNAVEKADFIADIYAGISTNYESLQSMIMVIFSALFGFNIATIIYVFRGGQRQAVKSKSSVAGLSVAVISGGCIACGTSIITPILTTIGATGSAALSREIGLYLNVVGIALTIYSLFSLGQRVATIESQGQSRG